MAQNPTLPPDRVRVVKLDGQPWFVAADVCNILGHTNPTVAIRILGETKKPKSDLGSGRPLNVVSESGLYKLVLRSDKPEAKAFQDWVTRVVFPAIRKDGGYILGEEKVASLENLGAPAAQRQQRTPSARHGPRGGPGDEDAPVHQEEPDRAKHRRTKALR